MLDTLILLVASLVVLTTGLAFYTKNKVFEKKSDQALDPLIEYCNSQLNYKISDRVKNLLLEAQKGIPLREDKLTSEIKAAGLAADTLIKNIIISKNIKPSKEKVHELKRELSGVLLLNFRLFWLIHDFRVRELGLRSPEALTEMTSNSIDEVWHELLKLENTETLNYRNLAPLKHIPHRKSNSELVRVELANASKSVSSTLQTLFEFLILKEIPIHSFESIPLIALDRILELKGFSFSTYYLASITNLDISTIYEEIDLAAMRATKFEVNSQSKVESGNSNNCIKIYEKLKNKNKSKIPRNLDSSRPTRSSRNATNNSDSDSGLNQVNSYPDLDNLRNEFATSSLLAKHAQETDTTNPNPSSYCSNKTYSHNHSKTTLDHDSSGSVSCQGSTASHSSSGKSVSAHNSADGHSAHNSGHGSNCGSSCGSSCGGGGD